MSPPTSYSLVNGQRYFGPDWAFNRRKRSLRPRTGGRWQPIWLPGNGPTPKPGFEALVCEILETLGIIVFHERLETPIPRFPIVPELNIRLRPRRQIICCDFFLPEYNMIIEIYSGNSMSSINEKRLRLRRISRMYNLRCLLLTPAEWEQLEQDPSIIIDWLHGQPLAA